MSSGRARVNQTALITCQVAAIATGLFAEPGDEDDATAGETHMLCAVEEEITRGEDGRGVSLLRKPSETEQDSTTPLSVFGEDLHLRYPIMTRLQDRTH